MPTRAWRVLSWLRFWPDALGLAGACAIGRGLWLLAPSVAWIFGGAVAVLVGWRLSPPPSSAERSS
ncbi:MAG: hypothetical protein HOQ34_10240 [Gemmatimonadaceae bacterium]|nr:hypothetical protein [Gemmatimonadaceae bacterium]